MPAPGEHKTVKVRSLPIIEQIEAELQGELDRYREGEA